MDNNTIDDSKIKIFYSLVIPCYNESENLVNLIERCEYILKQKEDIEVILVDNGSTDDTDEILTNILINIPKERLRLVRIKKNQGYGNGILVGLNKCKGEILGWTHADLQTDPTDFLRAISQINNKQNEIQVFIKGRRHGRPFRDVVFTWGMSLVEWIILGVRMRDINAQPTVFSRKFFLSWKNPPDDFSLDLFAYHEALRRSISIKRFPVNFGLRLRGKGHNEKLISKIKYSWRTILFSLKLRRHLKAKYE